MPSITKLPDSTVPRSEKDLLYSTLLALGGGADGVTKLPDSAVPRSNQDLLYSIMLAAQGISGGGSSLSISSQAQAEAGADNTTAMSPLRVDQRLALTFGTPTAVGKALLNLTNPGAISFLRLNADNTATALSAGDMRTALGLESVSPIILSVKNVTVLTSGAPADIASITVPSWVTRWILRGTGFGATSCFYSEAGSGDFSAASFICYDGAGATGNAVSSSSVGGATAQRMTGLSGATGIPFSTSNTIYIRQTANSANAATASFYLVVFPFL